MKQSNDFIFILMSFWLSRKKSIPKINSRKLYLYSWMVDRYPSPTAPEATSLQSPDLGPTSNGMIIFFSLDRFEFSVKGENNLNSKTKRDNDDDDGLGVDDALGC